MFPSNSLKPIKLFYSYAHEDEELRHKLEGHLALLKRQGVIAEWHDRKIGAGKEWKGQIDDNLNRASVILLLVSSDFLSSDYCYDVEMTRALERHKAKEARVIPIILRPVYHWSSAPFGGLQTLPKNGKAVTEWTNQDTAFVDVVEGIHKAAEEIRQVTIEHYANFVKRWGVFEGLGQPLTDEEVRHRQTTVRFYRRAGRVEKVQVINAQGKPTGHHDAYHWTELSRQNLKEASIKECQWEFTRDANDKMSYEWARDQAGRLVYGLHYSPTQDLTSVIAHYVDEAGFYRVRADSGAASVKYKRSHAGFDEELHYYDKSGNPQPDDNGSYGECKKLNKRGLPHHETNLGFNGKPDWRKDGYAKCRIAYDKWGNHIEEVCLGLDDQPTLHKDGFAKRRSKYDKWGNRIEEAYFDETNLPTRVKYGFARSTASYDERGNLVEGAFFDEAGQPVRHKDGYARWTARYDERGNGIEQSYFDEAGQPVRHKDGYARGTASYDEPGNLIEGAFFDEVGQPVRHKDGYARSTASYDERGNRVAQTFFDEAGQPTRNQAGYTNRADVYDDQGNLVEQAYWGYDGSDGFFKKTVTCDFHDKVVLSEAYFDAEGQPVCHKDGYARRIVKFDERGNRVETRLDDRGNLMDMAFFDAEGRPVRHEEGYSRQTAQYDGCGNRVAVANFDEEGRPTTDIHGHARWTARYDERGNQIEEAYFGSNGETVLHPDGYAKCSLEYDERAHEIEVAFFDQTGQPVCHRDGYARRTITYDEGGNAVEMSFFDAAGQPVRVKEGYSRQTAQYDGCGNRVAVANFDEEGRPTTDIHGHARWTARYDERGNRVEMIYFDESGQPVAPKGDCD
jgi:YD repeat-containing protein